MFKDKDIIRNSYENALSACARLSAFATCTPNSVKDRLTSDRQRILAANDLVEFAINARRLMHSTGRLAQFSMSMFDVSGSDPIGSKIRPLKLPITRVINTIVHNNTLSIWRFKTDVLLFSEGSNLSDEESASKHYMAYESLGNQHFPPKILLSSDKLEIMITNTAAFFEKFEQDVLVTIVDFCSEEGIYLNDIQID